MNPRHAAALALVGWALIFPPLAAHDCPGYDDAAAIVRYGSCEPWVDIGAPVNEWQVIRGFATVRDCEQFWKAQDAHPSWKALAALGVSHPGQLAAGRCTPDDDPRLKVPVLPHQRPRQVGVLRGEIPSDGLSVIHTATPK